MTDDLDRLATRLPAGFEFGVATSAYQIEGGAERDGKGLSIWDVFSRTPGMVADNIPGDDGAAHLDRWREDIGHLRALGVDTYRFSLSWPRLFPEGVGRTSQVGFDFYRRLIDEMLAAGIDPHVTLYHWDLPQALQERGGWAVPACVDWFADYAAAAFDAYGDVVPRWATLNEPIALWVGYGLGLFAPGIADRVQGRRAMHHAMHAHARGVQAFRASRAAWGEIGLAVDVWPRHPARDEDADRAHARAEEESSFRFFLDAALRGEHSPAGAALVASAFAEGETTMPPFEPVDFVGLNVYSRSVVSATDPDAHWWQPGEARPGGNYLANGMEYYPAAATEALRILREDYRWQGKVLITENGVGETVPSMTNAPLDDRERVRYVSGFLDAIADAVDEGSDVQGYYLWTLMDNYEWAAGYTQRFGVIAVDPVTRERTWKTSARWYRDLIAAHHLRARHPPA